MLEIKTASFTESRNILLVCLAIIVLSYLNFLFPAVEFLKLLLNDSGFFKHPESACITLNITGIPCAFCGMSRSLTSIVNLNFEKALYYNPASLIFYPLAGASFLSVVILGLRKRKVVITKPKLFWSIVFGVFLFLWILNILFGNQIN